MEAYLSYVVPLFLLLPPLSLYLITYPPKQASENPKNLPPGSKGRPVLGENMEFVISGPQNFVKHRMEKYSPDVFRTSLLGEELTVFCGERGRARHVVVAHIVQNPESTTGNYRELLGRLRSLTHDIVPVHGLPVHLQPHDN